MWLPCPPGFDVYTTQLVCSAISDIVRIMCMTPCIRLARLKRSSFSERLKLLSRLLKNLWLRDALLKRSRSSSCTSTRMIAGMSSVIEYAKK